MNYLLNWESTVVNHLLTQLGRFCTELASLDLGSVFLSAALTSVGERFYSVAVSCDLGRHLHCYTLYFRFKRIATKNTSSCSLFLVTILNERA